MNTPWEVQAEICLSNPDPNFLSPSLPPSLPLSLPPSPFSFSLPLPSSLPPSLSASSHPSISLSPSLPPCLFPYLRSTHPSIDPYVHTRIHTYTHTYSGGIAYVYRYVLLVMSDGKNCIRAVWSLILPNTVTRSEMGNVSVIFVSSCFRTYVPRVKRSRDRRHFHHDHHHHDHHHHLHYCKKTHRLDHRPAPNVAWITSVRLSFSRRTWTVEDV